MKRIGIATCTTLALICALVGGIAAVQPASGKPSAKSSPTASKSSTASPKAIPSKFPTPRASQSKKPSPSPTKTNPPSPKPAISKTPSPRPSASKKPSPSASPSQKPSPSVSPTPKPTVKPKPIVLPSTVASPPARVSGVDLALKHAMLQTGKKYVLGGVGPNNFDCSGLVQTAWKKAGVNLPRTSGQQFAATVHINLEDALPGDLIFYGQDGKQHVAIYIGFGLIVEAANPRKGVVISPIDTPWHHQNFGGVGRVVKNPSLIRQ